jgi:hypothetical protein
MTERSPVALLIEIYSAAASVPLVVDLLVDGVLLRQEFILGGMSSIVGMIYSATGLGVEEF